MEVKIGIEHTAREIVVEVDQAAEAVEQTVADAVAAGTLLALTDAKGRRVVVPGAKIAYVEIGTGSSGTVGFRS